MMSLSKLKYINCQVGQTIVWFQMQQYHKLPTITGDQLITLLVKDGWEACGRKTHGIGLKKKVGDRYLITVVPAKRTLVDFVLSSILGPKQTCIGKRGLLDLVNKYGL